MAHFFKKALTPSSLASCHIEQRPSLCVSSGVALFKIRLTLLVWTAKIVKVGSNFGFFHFELINATEFFARTV